MTRRKTRADQKNKVWLPFVGGFDMSPAISQSALQVAARRLNVAEHRLPLFYKRVTQVADAYRAAVHFRERPSAAEHAANLAPFQKAIQRLVREAENLPKISAHALGFPIIHHHLFERSQFQDCPPLLPYLVRLAGACKESLYSGHPGRPSKQHVARAADSLATIWSKYRDGKVFPLSLATSVGQLDSEGQPTKEFTSHPAQFVLATMQAFAPEVTAAEIASGLRSTAPGRKKLREKSRRVKKKGSQKGGAE